VANQTVNGFTPLNHRFAVPSVTQHDRLLDRVLASIPDTASVSAQDALNAHLSDRGNIFLYPDLDANQVQFIALDATQGTGSTIRPCDLYARVVGDPFPAPAAPLPCNAAVATASGQTPISSSRAVDQANAAQSLLHNGLWAVRFAQDGILLLERGNPKDPGRAALPPEFYTFITPWADAPDHHIVARFGDTLELDGYSIARREATNLRNADVVVTTWWRALKTPTVGISIMHYLTDSTGALQIFSSDQQATDWLPVSTWRAGSTYIVQSSQLTVKTNYSGKIDVDIGITPAPEAYRDISRDQRIRLLSGGGTSTLVGPCACNVLRLNQIEASL
jgi:hypothetical protein